MVPRGIDISHHQATTPNLTGLSFVFVRASIALSKDEKYAYHVANVRKAGLLVGAYHFGTSDDPEAQAAVFLKAAGDVDFYVLDLENYGPDRTMSVAQARRFIAACKPRKVGLYHSDANWPGDLGQAYNWVARWLATPPKRTWTFWQYRGSPLDLDRFNGTLDELKALALPLPDTSTGGTVPGLPLTLTSPLEHGSLRIPLGTDAINVETRVHYTVPINVNRPAVTASLRDIATEDGYLVDLDGDQLHFIRRSAPVTFTPAVAPVVSVTYPVTVGGKPAGSVTLP